ncbi:MAG: shikimate dehydrogenase [Bacteroidales bacterium]|nr:shikimate dehydrogenase [Bacteroidales bacterium]
MKHFGIVGHPLQHSFSPQYFKQIFREEKVNAEFYIYDIERIEQIKDIIQQDALLRGFVVTLPYKQSVMSYLQCISQEAQAIRAVNVIAIDKNEGLKGYNTDVIGLERSLKKHLTSHPKKALIIGNGGAAQAAKYVLDNMRVPYLIVNRTPAENVILYHQLTAEQIHECELIINATPVGMYPHTMDFPPINYAAIDEHHFLFDMIYNPQETLFMQNGKKRGAKVINGYEMLCIQADEAWKIWKKLA